MTADQSLGNVELDCVLRTILYQILQKLVRSQENGHRHQFATVFVDLVLLNEEVVDGLLLFHFHFYQSVAQ